MCRRHLRGTDMGLYGLLEIRCCLALNAANGVWSHGSLVDSPSIQRYVWCPLGFPVQEGVARIERCSKVPAWACESSEAGPTQHLSRPRLPRDAHQILQHISRHPHPCSDIHLPHDRELMVRAQLHEPPLPRKPRNEPRRVAEGIAAER